MSDDRRLVYSTDGSVPLPDVKTSKRARATSGKHDPPDDGIVRVGCEKRRAGSMTLVYGVPARELDALAAELKRRCGTGGTVKDGTISLQGDKRDVVIAYLTERGTRTKRMGG